MAVPHCIKLYDVDLFAHCIILESAPSHSGMSFHIVLYNVLLYDAAVYGAILHRTASYYFLFYDKSSDAITYCTWYFAGLLRSVRIVRLYTIATMWHAIVLCCTISCYMIFDEMLSCCKIRCGVIRCCITVCRHQLDHTRLYYVIRRRRCVDLHLQEMQPRLSQAILCDVEVASHVTMLCTCIFPCSRTGLHDWTIAHYTT